MLIKTLVSLVIFALFAYGVNTPPNDANGTLAINAGIFLLVAIALVKRVIVPKAVAFKRSISDWSFLDSYSTLAPDVTPVVSQKTKKAVKVEPQQVHNPNEYSYDYRIGQWVKVK